MLAHRRMGVMRAGLAVVLLALLVGAEHLDEESLQSLESSVTKEDISDDAELIGETKKVKLGLQKTGLKEFEDHAEMNLQQTDMPTIQEETLKASRENTKEEKQEDSTSELMEPLLVPDANDTRGSSTEVITESFHSDFPLNDALKEVTTKKSSVVPKKGVESKKPSVPKKGADPESVTPSVFARKGVDAEHLESSVSARKEADPKNNEERKEETIPFSGANTEATPEEDISDLPLYDENLSSPWKKITKKSSSVPRERMEEFKKASVAPKKDVDPNFSTPPVFAGEDVNSDGQQLSVSELKDHENNEECNEETIAYLNHLPAPQPSISVSEQSATSNDASSFSSDHSSTARETTSTISVSSESPSGPKENSIQEEDASKPDSVNSENEGRLSPGVLLVLILLVTFIITVVVGFLKMSGFEGIPRDKMDSAAQHGEDIFH
ncbi:uncharacterized protein [Panulirus ornatus]|uniref:uncharacterized protein isoform X2 n=1 Tax=Panulirus ornatus TaxID=150431 RepID=UPI003A8428EF